jgi:hypothetical protein
MNANIGISYGNGFGPYCFPSYGLAKSTKLPAVWVKQTWYIFPFKLIHQCFVLIGFAAFVAKFMSIYKSFLIATFG